MAKSNVDVVEVSIVNRKIVVQPDPVPVIGPDHEIQWVIITPGWTFPKWSNGINLKTPHSDFSNAASNPAGNGFSMRNRNLVAKKHKYSVYVEKGDDKPHVDPTIDNRG